jgi:hypothetical protein
MSLHFRSILLSAILSSGLICGPIFSQTAPTKQAPVTPPADQDKTEKKITPQQAKDLFRSVDEILHFASEDSKLPVKKPVKRRLTTRDEVEKYILEKFNEDEDAKRMQRAEIVLKKFGLLDRDFQLRPFLVSLLREQVAGYYDNKAKTVNLLDWIEPESQKPVLAHELTHALQDQHTDLEKWGQKTLVNTSKSVAEDNQHLASDEEDSSREAVLEGQAMVVFLDYSLQPLGKTLLTAPEVVDMMKDHMADTSDSPVLSRAPLLLEESMIFPYREGLSFEQQLLKDKGVQGAFVDALDHPPATSFEILNPHAYERGEKPPLLKMPDVHSLLDSSYDPYDVGAVGQLDVRILAKLFGGDGASAALTPAWDGGIYWAGQSKKAKTAAEKASTSSLAIFYLSAWKTPEAAKAFAKIYASDLDKKYSNVKPDAPDTSNSEEKTWQTGEGPVLIAVHGKQVFVSESFDLNTARKLELMVTGAQPTNEEMRTASIERTPSQELTSSWRHFFTGCGLMKAALPLF